MLSANSELIQNYNVSVLERMDYNAIVIYQGDNMN